MLLSLAGHSGSFSRFLAFIFFAVFHPAQEQAMIPVATRLPLVNNINRYKSLFMDYITFLFQQ